MEAMMPLTEDIVDDYRSLKLPTLKGQNKGNKRNVLNQWLGFCDQRDIELEDVHTKDVDDWVLWLKNKRRVGDKKYQGVSDATVEQYLIDLQSIYTWAQGRHQEHIPCVLV
jgi:site-specific recombinase XerD